MCSCNFFINNTGHTIYHELINVMILKISKDNVKVSN